MRFNNKKLPIHGEQRLIRRFLWFPKTIVDFGNAETRWLEWAEISQIYSEFYRSWRDQYFVSDELVHLGEDARNHPEALVSSDESG